MARTSTPTAQRYKAFWAQLLSSSNQTTSYSIRSPRRQASIEFCYLGLCFRYWKYDDKPNACVQFALARSDADVIFAQFLEWRTQIEQTFGASLTWEHTSHKITFCIASPPLCDIPPDQWSELQAQMIDAMVRLERAVFPHLQTWLEEEDFF